MTEKIPSISKINELFQNKEMKPSELFEQVYETASYTESVLHAPVSYTHLTLPTIRSV